MNSKQRRQRYRAFPHEFTIHAKQHERYFGFDERVDQANAWLKKQAKRSQWTRDRHGYNHQTFRFRDGGLATAFALKFS